MLQLMVAFSLAQAAPPAAPGDDIVGWFLSSMKWILEQFASKNYMPAAGMIIMVLVYVFHKFFESKIARASLPLVSAAIGVVAAVASNLMAIVSGAPSHAWITAILGGLTMGSAASGFWSLLGKKVVGFVADKAGAPLPEDKPSEDKPQ